MKKLVVILIAGIVALSSCTKRIDIDLNTLENQRLVVEGWVTNQMQQHQVELTLTTDYFDTQVPPPAINALVTISDGSQTWNLTEEEPGIYRTPEFAGEFGKTYTLNIDWSDENYTASSLLREVAPIDSMDFEYIDPLEEFGFEGDPWFDLLLWTYELEGEGDSYFWNIEVNGEPIRESLSDLSFVNDDLYDGNPISGIPVDALTYEEEAVEGDHIYIEQWNIGREAYDIFEAIMIETNWRGGLFDTPPANVQSNISNGALGYFGAAGISSFEGYIPN